MLYNIDAEIIFAHLQHSKRNAQSTHRDVKVCPGILSSRCIFSPWSQGCRCSMLMGFSNFTATHVSKTQNEPLNKYFPDHLRKKTLGI